MNNNKKVLKIDYGPFVVCSLVIENVFLQVFEIVGYRREINTFLIF